MAQRAMDVILANGGVSRSEVSQELLSLSCFELSLGIDCCEFVDSMIEFLAVPISGCEERDMKNSRASVTYNLSMWRWRASNCGLANAGELGLMSRAGEGHFDQRVEVGRIQARQVPAGVLTALAAVKTLPMARPAICICKSLRRRSCNRRPE